MPRLYDQNGNRGGHADGPARQVIGAVVAVPVEVTADEAVGNAVRAAIAQGRRALIEHRPAAERGEAEGVHQMRTSARRLRGELRAFRPVLDTEWCKRLEDELKWLGQVLGGVRDLDVLEANLREASADLGDALGPLFELIARRRDGARAALLDALASRRHADLIETLEDAAHSPELKPEAAEPCRTAIPPLVAKQWKSIKDEGRDLEADDPDVAYHDLRKHIKRVRYAAEAAAESLDPAEAGEARRFAKLVKRLQDLLGEHQDAAVACSLIEESEDEGDKGPAFHFAAGRLLERQLRDKEEVRDEFPDAWGKLDRKRLRKWFAV